MSDGRRIVIVNMDMRLVVDFGVTTFINSRVLKESMRNRLGHTYLLRCCQGCSNHQPPHQLPCKVPVMRFTNTKKIQK